MGLAFKQVVDGKRSWERRGNFVGGSQCRTDITASIPGDLRMIFEVQQEPFFHQATEGLPAWLTTSCFPTGNPARNALSSNFEQVDATNSNLRHDLASRISGTKSLWRISICSCPNLEPDFRSLGLICPNLRPIYQGKQDSRCYAKESCW